MEVRKPVSNTKNDSVAPLLRKEAEKQTKKRRSKRPVAEGSVILPPSECYGLRLPTPVKGFRYPIPYAED
ncbi:MAG: hypothetical protein KGI06_02665 [Candidatus Micrarchaeota archaeon]|nr:hypothetical protein [Candidatus Micrarchaeota archaeon]